MQSVNQNHQYFAISAETWNTFYCKQTPYLLLCVWHLQARLEPTLVEPIMVLHSKDKFPVLLTNIRLRWR
jgi:hypothetical protein